VSKLKADQGAVLVVMAGGSGTRFWPFSRVSKPKQYLPLAKGGRTLIEESILRLEDLVGKDATVVVTAESQVEILKTYCPDVDVLAEPLAKNTAACLALAAHYVLKTVGDVPMICTPADHLVKGESELRAVFKKAIALCQTDDVLVTIGIKPTYPETGYGYIKGGNSFQSQTGKPSGSFQVEKFVEKPDGKTALKYVESGEYYWNSGMFVWKPSVILKAIKEFLPNTARLTELTVDSLSKGASKEEIFNYYSNLESVSIDQGVLEEAKNVVVYPGYSFNWSDIGSWQSWYDNALEESGDSHQNVVVGEAICLGSEGCAVFDATQFNGIDAKGQSKLIALVGLEDIVVVETEDCLLVCKKSESQKVKQIVDLLKEKKMLNRI
jgi:mannose-1-phosphate guanylyltransferase